MDKRAGAFEIAIVAIVILIIFVGAGFAGTINKSIKKFLGIAKSDEIVEVGNEQDTWSKILADWNNHKCEVDLSTCRAINLPCQCFSKERKENKQRPEECTQAFPNCFEGTLGCESSYKDYYSQYCKEVLKDRFKQPAECKKDANGLCINGDRPCTCTKRRSTGEIIKTVCDPAAGPQCLNQ